MNCSLPLISLLSVTFSLSSVSAHADLTRLENIQVTSTVSADKIKRLQLDLNYLKSLQFNHADPEMISLMELQSATPESLLGWMEDRVHFIIDESLDLPSSVYASSGYYFYANPGVFPLLETPTQQASEQSIDADAKSTGKVMTVMSNVGGTIYLSGKASGQLLMLNIPGIGLAEVRSPRVGILKVGPGLFAKIFADPSLSPDSKPYITMRLATLFHEARHSDGNGESLSFLHAACPSGTYAGYLACDRNLNGPYQIQTKFINSLISACTDCTAGDLQAMRVLAADTASRQIAVSPDPNANDPISV
jgi:hypothetical protein